MHTMLIRPTKEELASFGEPQFVIINAGAFPANKLTTGMGSTTSVDLNIESKELVILDTEYAGEMKKGVFTVANYLAPKRGVLSMHCSATADKKTGVSSLLFGLSGTGKTTLSADPQRHLIADDEHCWSDDGIFNIEGGCYAPISRPRASLIYSRRCASARFSRMWFSMKTKMWISPTQASRSTRAARIPSNSLPMRKSRAWPVIRPT
jgi:ATP-dependent phosphoenolpyruvate carboxykinase